MPTKQRSYNSRTTDEIDYIPSHPGCPLVCANTLHPCVVHRYMKINYLCNPSPIKD